jgi:UDP-N-acetylmuramate--alanine ligase
MSLDSLERSLGSVPSQVAADFRGRRVHLIGIGGSGMIGVARLLLDLGAVVSGSDREEFDGMGDLVRRGATVRIGHHAANVPDDATLIVHSAAIPNDNCELALALGRGIARLTYFEALGVLMRCRDGVAIAGTHGKSTTTAMTAFVFREVGLDPSFVVGGRCDQLGGSSGAGSGPHFIVESCEFNRSFLHLRPQRAAVLNVESDHLDYYSGLDEIVGAFGDFCRQVTPGGLVVCNGEDPFAIHAARSGSARVQTFGREEGVDWRATALREESGCYSFSVAFRGRWMLDTRLSIAGLHNVYNALATIALAYDAGADPMAIGRALPEFRGVSRRMTLRGQAHGVTILDDYAHHPTEIRVTIEAARDRYRPRRTLVVFQPHQYSRTRAFLDDFAQAFVQADEVVVPDIYHAREAKSDYGAAGSQELVSRICASGRRACYLPSFEAVTDHVVRSVSDGDLVMTMGAGDVWKVADGLVARICTAN